MSIRIICDSTCDLTTEEAAELGVTLVPLKVLFGTEEYYDGVDMKPDAFFKKMAVTKDLPTTSQPSPEAFLQFLREAKKQEDDVICILIASKLSGTCQSALVARGIADYDRIFIVDSGQATIGVQLLVKRALDLCRMGKTAEEIVAVIEEEKEKIRIYAIVDTLVNLQKGGRLSSAGMAVGTALNLKPVICVSDGEVHVAGLARGMKNAYEKMMKAIDKDGGMDESRPYIAGYAGDPSSMEPFTEFLSSRMKNPNDSHVAVGSVIGVHIGPGANALAVSMK